MNRGSTAGTLTRANRARPWKITATATFMLRLARIGSGRPGSNASGVSTGAISRANTPDRCAAMSALQAGRSRRRIPAASSAVRRSAQTSS